MRSAAIFSVRAQTTNFLAGVLVCSGEVSYVLNGWYSVLEQRGQADETNVTFCKYLPFARLATGRVGQNVVQVVKQSFHLASALSFGHLVADTKLGGSTVASAAGRQRIRRVHVLQGCDAAVLHRVMMCTWNVWASQ